MTNDTCQLHRTVPHDSGSERRPERHWYSMYGRRVRSDVRLPLPVTPIVDALTQGWDFRLAAYGQPVPPPDGPLVAETRCDRPCHRNRVVSHIHRGPAGAWFWFDAIGTFHVRPGALRVDVYPAEGADERALGLVLTGQLAVFLLHQSGTPTLHASAVATEYGAAVFFGPKGQGKSTMAASFLRRAATLLTDDVLALRLREGVVEGVPGPALMKVWAATAEHTLALSEELPDLAAGLDKKLLTLEGRYPMARAAIPLRGLYVLNRYDSDANGRTEVTLRMLTSREGLAVLLAHISHGAALRPAEVARFLPIYASLLAQAPVRILSYPHGFVHQEDVHARIMADLAEAR